MRRLAIKLAYDGRRFHGSQRQPGLRTVEGDLLRGLERLRAIHSIEEARFQMASRTDRGVSAIGNVMAVDTEFDPREMLRAMNAVCEDIFLHAVAEVAPGTSVRRAEGRWYRHLLPSRGLDVPRVRECAALFVGEHDMARFCRPEGKDTRLRIDGVSVLVDSEMLAIDVRATHFLWNQVRRMVAAMEAVGSGNASLEEVSRALEGEDIVFGIASPEGLTLMDISYPFAFQTTPTVTLERRLDSELDAARWRLSLLEGIRRRVG